MRNRSANSMLCAMLLLAASGVSPTRAQDADDDGCEFRATPYLFAAGLDGKTGVGPVTTGIDMSFGDVLDRLDFAFMMTATARKGRWIAGLDAMYFKLSGARSNSVTGPFGVVTIEGTVELGCTEQIYQPTIAYRAFYGDAPVLDFYIAARYTSLETDMTLSSTSTIPSFPGGGRELSGDVSWWDPIIGKRVKISFTDRLFATTVVDCGGFGVGSDITYQFLATGGWRFTDHIDAALGYRYFKQDYEKDGVVWIW